MAASKVVSVLPALTPRELALRNRAIAAERKIESLREHYERMIQQMKERHAKESDGVRVVVHRAPPLEAKDYIKNAEADIRLKEAHHWRSQLEALSDLNEMLEARISAGIWRRTRLFHVACTLLKCEDDDTLTDEQHDALMDEAIRHARTVVSLERLAREEDRARLAQRLAQKEGA